ncbi:MAG: hypothetical protein KDA51_14005, partial [Planctomycetales bacterium]|nr:hypothetical protein [Planctomycetales bacterium]
DLEMVGFEKLCKFLECPNPGRPFPNSNTHSQRPQAAFMQALIDGTVTSLTGIQTTGMPLEHSKSKGAGLSK